MKVVVCEVIMELGARQEYILKLQTIWMIRVTKIQKVWKQCKIKAYLIYNWIGELNCNIVNVFGCIAIQENKKIKGLDRNAS